MPHESSLGHILLPDLHCACATVRRTARLVTQFYGKEMGQRIEPEQFAMLTVLSHRPGASQSSLGRIMGTDKTTMSRNLRVLLRNGWVQLMASEDKRQRGYRLSAAGQKMLSEVKPSWMRAQAKLRAALTDDEWQEMLRLFGRVAEAALRERHKD
jgi:DNA-binding MarR family transcriptional regulator